MTSIRATYGIKGHPASIWYDTHMAKYLILHGTNAGPDSNWFMWLKGVLIGKGHEVWLPQLPNAEKPNTKTYNEFILSSDRFKIDSDTTLIGHSSGAVATLSLLQHLPADASVKAAVLVSAFKDDLSWESLSELFVEPLDFPKITAHCQKFTFIHSDDDPHVPLDHAKYLADAADGELIVFEGQGHFNTETGPQYKQFPELLEFIDC